jgi:hypothetical protein
MKILDFKMLDVVLISSWPLEKKHTYLIETSHAFVSTQLKIHVYLFSQEITDF